jgi:hypothetical protein
MGSFVSPEMRNSCNVRKSGWIAILGAVEDLPVFGNELEVSCSVFFSMCGTQICQVKETLVMFRQKIPVSVS